MKLARLEDFNFEFGELKCHKFSTIGSIVDPQML